MNGHYFFFGILMIFLISTPIFLIWEWNKNRQLTLKEALRIYLKKYGFYIVLILIIMISDNFVPLNKNHGIEFNSERENLGIPIIETEWKKNRNISNKYLVEWLKPNPVNGHFKKVIEYGFFDIKTETDFFTNEKNQEIITSSKFDYRNNSFEYFLEKRNKTERSEHETKINKINKLKFEQLTFE